MMDPAKKLEWIEALESDKYKQTTGNLCNGETVMSSTAFCCIGVLAHINGYDIDNFHSKMIGDEYVDSTKAVRMHFGIEADLSRSLVALNDEDRATFKEIAVYIRNQLDA